MDRQCLTKKGRDEREIAVGSLKKDRGWRLGKAQARAQLCGTYLSMRSNSIPRAAASVARSAVIVSAALTRIVRVCRVRSRTDLLTGGHVQKLVLAAENERTVRTETSVRKPYGQ